MMDQTQGIAWLKKRFREAAADGPEAKRVKFQAVHQSLAQGFPSVDFNSKTVSDILNAAFPHTRRKQVGKSHLMHVFGLEEIQEGQQSSDILQRISILENELFREREKNAKLLERVHELELQLEQYQKVSCGTLNRQLDAVMNPRHLVYHGPDTVEHLEQFSIDGVVSELKQHAPDLHEMFQSLGKSSDDDPNREVKIITSLCTLIKSRSKKVLGLQLLISFMLLARSTSKQAISVLNHGGVCASYVCAWKYLRQLTVEAHYQELIQTGHWLWNFDNVNLQQRVRHEREDKHAHMLNITSRIAIRIRHLPNWEFDWSDTTPQCSRASLTAVNFLMSEEDAAEIHERAVRYMMRYMVSAFSTFSDLKQFVTDETPLHPVVKTEVVPMKVLFRDEKYVSETIEILTDIAKDAQLLGQPQVVVGDQLTCKNIRSSKLWRQNEKNTVDTLAWACETPGDFHFLWECLRVVFSMFWGVPSQDGSLSNLRSIIRRLNVDEKVKVFNVGDEFLMHAFQAHLTTAIMEQLKLENPSAQYDHPCSLAWLRSEAEKLVNEVLAPTESIDPINCMHKAFLHVGYSYVDLREAIRWEYGPHIIRHWKWWLPRFLATGCSNYASEAVNLIANMTADYPKHIAYIATHNRTVNTKGKPGHGKPVDQMIEHYNLVFKQTLRSAGGNLTERHVEEVSLSALFLLDAAKKTDAAFGVAPQTTAHTIRDPGSDVSKMVKHLVENKVSLTVEDRLSPAFTDPTDKGYKKLCSSWLNETLSRSHVVDYNSPPSEIEDLVIADDDYLHGREVNNDDIDIDYEQSDVL